MAKFRQVFTEFWQDSKVVEEMTPEDKYFYLYLLTNSHTTQIGIYEITKKQMSFDLGYSLESVTSLLDRFIYQHKIIIYNEETKEIAIKNWGRYNLNRAGKPMMDLIEKELSLVKDKRLIYEVGRHVKHDLIRELFESSESYFTYRGEYCGQEEEQEEEEEEEQEKEVLRKSEKYKFENVHMKLAELLFKKIRENNSTFREPNFKSWANDIRLMMEVDKREGKQIQDVILFCQGHEFWHVNILSVKKLRKQFDRLLLEMTKEERRMKKKDKGVVPDWFENRDKPKAKEEVKQEYVSVEELEKMMKKHMD